MLNQSRKWELLDSFFRAHTRIQYKKGDIVIRPEEAPSGVYLIESGFIKAYTITKYGEENLLLVRATGSVFPLIWAFTGEHRNITYEAMEATTLWRVGQKEYLEFLNRHPDILPIILDMAIEAYRLHSERVMTLSYRTARERIVSFLLTNVDRFGILNADGSQTIHAPYRQADIASSVNATRETTNREVNLLKKKNLISIDNHKIIVHDVDALRKML